MNDALKRMVCAVALLAFGGCAAVDPGPDYQRAREEVTAATGAEALYRPGEEDGARERTEALLEGGLTSLEAVQVALLNNLGLRDELFEIGLRRADAVQAGLLSNPSLEAILRFPLDGGPTAAEGGLLHNLIELWRLPARKRKAEREVERTVLAIARRAVDLAARAKAAYFAAIAAKSALAAAEANLETAHDSLELTLARQEAGAATQVDVNAARSTFLEQQVLVRAARFAAFDAVRRLTVLLGIATPPENLELVDALETPRERPVRLDRLYGVAQEHRLDLRVAAADVLAAESAIPLERRRVWRTFRVGVAFESRGGDEFDIGPSIDLDLPLFDRNQARIAKAEMRYARALRRLEGLTRLVSQDVRGAFERYAVARDTARLYREQLLPLREASLALAQEAFTAGKTGFLSVLEAQNRLLATRREYVDRLEAVALSIPALEVACGRPIDVLLEEDGG